MGLRDVTAVPIGQEDEKKTDLQSGQDLVQGEASPTSDQNVTLSLTPTMTGSGTSAQKPQTQGRQGSTGGQRYRNLKKLIDKNQQTNIAGKIGEGLQREAGQIESQADKARDLFEQKKTAEETRQDVNVFGEEGQFDISKAQQIADDEDKTKRFQSFLGNQNVDVTSGKTGQLERDLSGFSEKVGQVGTETGRLGLLKDRFGTGRTYGGGAQNIDAMLLGSKKSENDVLKRIQGEVSKAATQDIQELRKREDLAQQELAGSAAQKAEDIQEGLKGYFGETASGAKEEAKNKFNKALADYNTKKLALEKGQLSQSDYDQLGIKEGQRTYGLDKINLGNYLLGAPEDVSLSQVMTPEQIAQYQALQQVAGDKLGTDYLDLDPTLSGTYDPKANVDYDSIKGIYSQQKHKYNNAVKKINKYYANISSRISNETGAGRLKNEVNRLQAYLDKFHKTRIGNRNVYDEEIAYDIQHALNIVKDGYKTALKNYNQKMAPYLKNRKTTLQNLDNEFGGVRGNLNLEEQTRDDRTGLFSGVMA